MAPRLLLWRPDEGGGDLREGRPPRHAGCRGEAAALDAPSHRGSHQARGAPRCRGGPGASAAPCQGGFSRSQKARRAVVLGKTRSVLALELFCGGRRLAGLQLFRDRSDPALHFGGRTYELLTRGSNGCSQRQNYWALQFACCLGPVPLLSRPSGLWFSSLGVRRPRRLSSYGVRLRVGYKLQVVSPGEAGCVV